MNTLVEAMTAQLDDADPDVAFLVNELSFFRSFYIYSEPTRGGKQRPRFVGRRRLHWLIGC